MTLASRQLSRMQVADLIHGFGAEVTGIQLRDLIGHQSAINSLRSLWFRKCVLVFRNQNLTDQEQIAFSRHFGELELFPQKANCSPNAPEIFRVSNTTESGAIEKPENPNVKYLTLGRYWHKDSSFRRIPSLGAILRAVEIPNFGGDTEFADLRTAYAELSHSRKLALSRLSSVHCFVHSRSLLDLPPLSPEEAQTVAPTTHPLVAHHEYESTSIFLSPLYMKTILGLTADEAKLLLHELTAWCTQPRYVYRHRWEIRDVIMWDNRTTMHRALPYDDAHSRRTLHRTVVAGRGYVDELFRT